MKNGSFPSKVNGFLTWRRTERGLLATNVLSLYGTQAAAFLPGLVLIPYLAHVFGPATFGRVTFAQSLVTYVGLLVDYGFNLSATRKIAVNRGDRILASRIASDTWSAKTLLTCSGAAALLILAEFVPRLAEVRSLLFLLYGIVLGNAMHPTWLFQGMERMAPLALIGGVTQVAVLGATLAFVRQPGDYLLYAAIVSAGSITAGVAGSVVAARAFRLGLVRPTLHGTGGALRDGGALFLSVASTSFYTTGNAFLLGLLAGPVAVAYYSAVEKVMGAAAMLLAPITHATYPLFSRVASTHTTGRVPFGPRMIIVVGGLGLILSVIVWATAPVIVSLLFGPEFEASVLVLRILAGCIAAYAVANVFTQQILLPFGRDKAFTTIVVFAAVLDVAVALALVPAWGAAGMAVAALAASAFVPVAALIYMSAEGLLPSVRRPAAADVANDANSP